jgi:recombination protein RecA
LSYEQRQLILGSLLGDGSLAPSSTGYFFRLCHGDPQLEYLLWKQSILQELSPAARKSYQKLFRGKLNTQHHIHTIVHPEFDQIRDWSYQGKTRIITPEILDSIDAFGLAVWYMDDGSFLKAYNSRQVVFCTDRYSKEEVDLLQRWLLEKFGIETVLQPCKTRVGDRFRLRINRTKAARFFEVVKPYMCPSMEYKLPEQVAFPAD